MSELREQLASLSHEIWSDWMEWMFGRGRVLNVNMGNEVYEYWVNDCWVMPPSLYERWMRQINTPYGELSESEKDMDREQADKIIKVLISNNVD